MDREVSAYSKRSQSESINATCSFKWIAGSAGERNITQGQLLLDVYNCGLLVHLQCLLHHNQSDTSATHISAWTPKPLSPTATVLYDTVSALNANTLKYEVSIISTKTKRMAV